MNDAEMVMRLRGQARKGRSQENYDILMAAANRMNQLIIENTGLRNMRNDAVEALESVMEDIELCELCNCEMDDGRCRLAVEDPEMPCTPVWKGRRVKRGEHTSESGGPDGTA